MFWLAFNSFVARPVALFGQSGRKHISTATQSVQADCPGSAVPAVRQSVHSGSVRSPVQVGPITRSGRSGHPVSSSVQTEKSTRPAGFGRPGSGRSDHPFRSVRSPSQVGPFPRSDQSGRPVRSVRSPGQVSPVGRSVSPFARSVRPIARSGPFGGPVRSSVGQFKSVRSPGQFVRSPGQFVRSPVQVSPVGRSRSSGHAVGPVGRSGFFFWPDQVTGLNGEPR